MIGRIRLRNSDSLNSWPAGVRPSEAGVSAWLVARRNRGEGHQVAVDEGQPVVEEDCCPSVRAGDELGADHRITARGKHVVVVGGGDTGSDCVGTANRQGACTRSRLTPVTAVVLINAPPTLIS